MLLNSHRTYQRSLKIFCFLILSGARLNNTWGASADLPLPFWKTKPEMYKRMREERAILVSAHAGDAKEIKGPLKQALSVVVGGLVAVPLEASYKVMRDFDRLPKADEHFTESKWRADLHELDLALEAYGYRARMTLKISERTESEHKKIIAWESIRGSFIGMKGEITAEDYKRQATEISMTAYYASAKLPLPSLLMGVGLEIVAQRAAAKLRSYIEENSGEKKRRL